MNTTPMYLTQHQVAAFLCQSFDWLIRNKQRLQRDHGFPPPVSFLKRPHWDSLALERWAEQQRPAHLRVTPDNRDEAGASRVTIDMTDELRGRAKGLKKRAG